jgi:hypothetical protein
MGRLYPAGDLRGTLRLRAVSRANRHADRKEREAASQLAAAIARGESVVVTFDAMKGALWAAKLADAADLDALYAAKQSHYRVDPNGAYEPVAP